MQSGQGHESFLVVRAHMWICGIPLTSAIETMRALPVEPVAGAPSFFRGLAIIRGAALPVVSLAALLGGEGGGTGGRFVTVRSGYRMEAAPGELRPQTPGHAMGAALGRAELRPQTPARHVVLEVDQVLGARTIDASALEEAPPLLRDALRDHVTAIGALDGRLLTLLETSHLIPEALWSTLESA